MKNQPLASAGYQWAFNALAASPGVKAHYQRRPDHGDWHNAALRHLINRQLGILYHCLTTRQTYQETKAFPRESERSAVLVDIQVSAHRDQEPEHPRAQVPSQ